MWLHSVLTYYYIFIITYYYVIITSLLHDYYIIITNGKSCNNDSIVTCSAKRKSVWLWIVTYYYLIITLGSIITHYYLLQSPALAGDWNHFLHPCPLPSVPAGSSGSDCWPGLQRQLKITGNLQLQCAAAAELVRHVFIEFLVGNFVELHVPGVCCLVAGCLAAKAEKF